MVFLVSLFALYCAKTVEIAELTLGTAAWASDDESRAALLSVVISAAGAQMPSSGLLRS